MTIDLRWMKVTCAGEGCGKVYQCTPDTDYFHTTEQEKDPEFEKTADNGYCWDCFMKVVRMQPQPEPPYISDN